MMDELSLTPLVQFGVAGLMAWMWTTERRASQERERQLTQSHERLMEQRVQLDALLKAVTDGTRAVAALEASQRSIVAALRMSGLLRPPASRDADDPGGVDLPREKAA